MSNDLIHQWRKDRRALSIFRDWQEMEGKINGNNNKPSFYISPAHCSVPQLVRAGQFSTGGENYHKTEREANIAILEYLIENWEEIGPKVEAILEEKARKSLIACQEYVTEMQTLIDSAKES